MGQFTMPSLGADMDAGTLVEWLVHEGDEVHRGDPMAVVDTDKSAIEVESFDDGVVEAFLVEPGTRVAVGTPLATLGPTGAPGPAAAAPAPAVSAAAVAPAPAVPTTVPAPRAPSDDLVATQSRTRLGSPPVRHHAAELGVDLAAVTGTGRGGTITRADVDRAAARAPKPKPPAPTPGRRRISPYARRLAQELGVDLEQVSGSGEGGTVLAEDVRAAAPATAAVAEAPAARPPAPGPSAARATIAKLMSRAKREIPHYYVATTVDLFALTSWLRKTNRDRPMAGRIVPAAGVLRATALAAREFPELNGFWVDDGFVPAEDVHLGVAIVVRNGALVAPAIHGAADLDLPTMMERLRDLVSRARAGRLRRAELADPTLTVTDLGDQGVEEVVGVIYPPQVALLGVGRVVERPWAVDGLIGVRPVVRLTLSGDHRATDGFTGARFLATVDRLLQHPEEL